MPFHFCFVSLVGISIGITSSAVGLKICVITARIKKHNSLRKKKEETIIVCIDSNISHD